MCTDTETVDLSKQDIKEQQRKQSELCKKANARFWSLDVENGCAFGAIVVVKYLDAAVVESVKVPCLDSLLAKLVPMQQRRHNKEKRRVLEHAAERAVIICTVIRYDECKTLIREQIPRPYDTMRDKGSARSYEMTRAVPV